MRTGKMRLRGRTVIVCLAVVTVAAFAAVTCRSRAPSDAEVIARFEARANGYEDVRRMLEADPKVGIVARGFLCAVEKPYLPATVTQVGITPARLDEYLRALDALDVGRVDRYSDVVQFSVWASGFAGKTHHKGIVWRATPPASKGGRRFTLIRDKWYVYQD